MFLAGKRKVDDTEQATVLSCKSFKIERVGAKVSEVETSRYNEMNTESRVRDRLYSVHAPWGRGFLKCVHTAHYIALFSNNGVILRAGGSWGQKRPKNCVSTLWTVRNQNL